LRNQGHNVVHVRDIGMQRAMIKRSPSVLATRIE